MNKKLTAIAGLSIVLAGSLATSVDATPNDITTGYITGLGGGWVDPHLRIVLDSSGTFPNPENCINHDGYIIPSTLAANQLLSSMALTAYSMHKRVKLTVDGCFLDRPKVIGLVIVDN